MSNKNPYEIRFEVLRMAQSHAYDKYHVNRDTAMRQWENDVETARLRGEKCQWKLEMPKFPTEEEILQTARCLITFIND